MQGLVALFTAFLLLLLSPSLTGTRHAHARSAEKKGRGEMLRKQKQLVNRLYEEKCYFDCIAETRRLMVYDTDRSRNAGYEYFILGLYYQGKQYRSVLRIISSPREGPRSFPTLLLASQSYLRLGMTANSLAALKRIDYSETTGEWRYDLLIRRTDAALHAGDFKGMTKEIQRYRSLFPEDHRAEGLQRDCLRHRDISRRSVPLAATLSTLIPGSGQMYTGRYSSGIISFAAIVACGLGAYYSYQRGDKPIAYTLAFFTVLFHGGNIYGAYNSAESHNRESLARFREGIQKNHIPPYDPMKYSERERLLR